MIVESLPTDLVSKEKLVSMHLVKLQHMSITGLMKVLLALVEQLMHLNYVNTESAKVSV